MEGKQFAAVEYAVDYIGESLKLVGLSSMNVGTALDAKAVEMDDLESPIPDSEWMFDGIRQADRFALIDGDSIGWKENAPTVEIALERELDVRGWVTNVGGNTDADNLHIWGAAPAGVLVPEWRYKIVATLPGDDIDPPPPPLRFTHTVIADASAHHRDTSVAHCDAVAADRDTGAAKDVGSRG